MKDEYLNAINQSRRTFIKKSGVVFATGTIGLSLAGCDSMDPEEEGPNGGPVNTGVTLSGTTLSIDMSIQTKLQNAGGFVIVGSASGTTVNVIVINTDGAEFKAFTAVCTHQECNVDNYDSSSERIICPCHGSEFDLNGEPQEGPAPSALEEYTVTRSGDNLSIALA